MGVNGQIDDRETKSLPGDKLHHAVSTASNTSSGKRRLYRQGSLSSQISGHVEEVMIPLKDHETGSLTGSYAMRKRSPSGKSVISRTVSVAEYHEELKKDIEQKVTRNLLLLSFIIFFGSSFLFGYNIGVLNQPTKLIQTFYNETYTERLGAPLNEYTLKLLWSLTTALYFPGGMIGAFSAGFLADRVGRKRAVLLSHIPALIGAVLQFLCVYASSPELLMVGRFVQGINCGLASQLAPMYITEIVPFNLRGAFGTGHQLFVTIGILVGSILGLSHILGTSTLWPVLLLFNAGPALISLVILPFLPESPRHLLINKGDRLGAEDALRFLRQRIDVQPDIEEMDTEGAASKDGEDSKQDNKFTMMKLLQTRLLRVPLIITIVLQIAQQFSGINAIFFYSVGIFEVANVKAYAIQYAVVLTNLVNVFMTVIAVPVMDRAGRRPLLLYPMMIMTLDMVVITIALYFQKSVPQLSYLSIFCVVLYVICFAIGLGPIPLMTGAELFRQGPRSMALSAAGFTNWLCTTIIAVGFEIVAKALGSFVFIIFAVLMLAFTTFVKFKVPETKNKTFEEIANMFQPGGTIEVEEYMEDDVDNESHAPEDVFNEGSPLKKNSSEGSLSRVTIDLKNRGSGDAVA